MGVEERGVVGFTPGADALGAVRLAGGDERPCAALFVRPRQRQVPVVEALGLALDDQHFLRVDDEQRTSIPAIYAAGDLVCHDHGALAAAASGSRAAHRLNHELTLATVRAGLL